MPGAQRGQPRHTHRVLVVAGSDAHRIAEVQPADFGMQARIFKRKDAREHAQQRRRVLYSAQCLQRDCVRRLRIQLEEQRAQCWIEAGHPGGAAAM